MQLFDVLRFIWNHPLNEVQQVKAIIRFLRWQIGSRILGKPVVFSWVNDARLVVGRGMTAATGNIYVGLMSYEEMAFLLHYLRPDDVFFDIGANVGTYTILAAKAVGARCTAVEPDPENLRALVDNLRINGVDGGVKVYNVAAGRERGRISFCSGMGAVSCVLQEGGTPGKAAIEIEVVPIDSLADTAYPDVLKIDVEGFESEVLSGGGRVLEYPKLNVMIVELRGHGKRYGFDERVIHEKIQALGFKPCRYDPVLRKLAVRDDNSLGDMLYIRDLDMARNRVTSAPRYQIGSREL